jgi:hypothetical protein
MSVARKNFKGETVGMLESAPFVIENGNGQRRIMTRSLNPSCFSVRAKAANSGFLAVSLVTKLERRWRQTMKDMVAPMVEPVATMYHLMYQLALGLISARLEYLPIRHTIYPSSQHHTSAIPNQRREAHHGRQEPENQPSARQRSPALCRLADELKDLLMIYQDQNRMRNRQEYRDHHTGLLPWLQGPIPALESLSEFIPMSPCLCYQEGGSLRVCSGCRSASRR